MVRVMRVLAFVVLAGTAAVAAVRTPAPPATPAPPPNLLAPVMSEALGQAAPEVASSQEWMVIQAARVIEDWSTMRQQAELLRQRFPGHGDVYAALGAALEGLGSRAEAIVALERAVELKPDHKGAWLMLALLSSASGDHARAAAAYERGISLDPKDGRALTGAALAYARTADHAKAAPAFARLAAAYPSDVDAWVMYARESTAAGTSHEMWIAFNDLRGARPDIAARVAAALPAELRGALPTPIPPTPRPTARPGTPRLVMGGGPPVAAGGGTGSAKGSSTVWTEAALAFETKVVPIARRARPLAEMMQRYDVSCRGGHASRSRGTGSAGDGGRSEAGQATEGDAQDSAAPEIDWTSVWARRDAWTTAAANDNTAECRALASEMLALANSTRTAVETAAKETAGTGISDADKAIILEKYRLRW